MTFVGDEVGSKMRAKPSPSMRSLAQSSTRNRPTARTFSWGIAQYALVMISQGFLIATRVLRIFGY